MKIYSVIRKRNTECIQFSFSFLWDMIIIILQSSHSSWIKLLRFNRHLWNSCHRTCGLKLETKLYLLFSFYLVNVKLTHSLVLCRFKWECNEDLPYETLKYIYIKYIIYIYIWYTTWSKFLQNRFFRILNALLVLQQLIQTACIWDNSLLAVCPKTTTVTEKAKSDPLLQILTKEQESSNDSDWIALPWDHVTLSTVAKSAVNNITCAFSSFYT